MLSADCTVMKAWKDPAQGLPFGAEDDECRAYAQHEVFLDAEGRFQQTRSGPNWEGGVVTLTTCKQLVRSIYDWNEWPGVYFAGFAPAALDNALIYLGRISRSFASIARLRDALDKDVVAIKEAELNPVGDIYRPIHDVSGDRQWDHNNFASPSGHTRMETYPDGTPKWWKDIDYRGFGDRHPAVFIFDPVWVWDRPMFRPTFNLGRSGRKMDFSDVLKGLIPCK